MRFFIILTRDRKVNSTGRRNTFDYSLFDQPVESLRWRLPAERFAWSRDQRMSNSAQFIVAV